MPAPAVYIVVAVIGATAAGIAFKQFVYDPHLAPKVDEWTKAFAAFGREMLKTKRKAASHTTMASSDDGGSDNGEADVELQSMVEREMHVVRDGSATIRRRHVAPSSEENPTILDKSNPNFPFAPITPTSASTSNDPFADPSELSMPLRRLSLASGLNSSSISEPSPNTASTGTHHTRSLHPNSPPLSGSSFVLPTSAHSISSHTDSEHMGIRLDSAGSRSETPFTDAAFNQSFTNIRSATPAFSEITPSEASFASYINDAEDQLLSSFVLPSATSENSAGSEDQINRATNIHPQVASTSQPLRSGRSPSSVASKFSDEDWDRLSEV